MTFDLLKQKLLADPEVREHYTQMQPEFDLAKELIKLRSTLGLTQRQLAEMAGMHQPQLARIESGKQLPRLDTLEALVESVGYSLSIQIVPRQS